MQIKSWLIFALTASTVSYGRQWAFGIGSPSVAKLIQDAKGSIFDLSTQIESTFTKSYPTEPVLDLLNSWTPPLSTRGRYIVDANGQRFKLIGGNWHGASGTYLGSGDLYDSDNHHAGEMSFQTPLCLDRVPIDEIVQSFLDLGITTIRLPFSNEMIHSVEIPPDVTLRANPQFKGMTPLEIYDECIKALTKRGLAVILNNHTVKSIWCCGVDSNARWNKAQTDEQWQEDWIFMTKRYKSNARVIGVELYNEVRRDILEDPTWGSGTFTDWWNASQTIGTRILRESNSNLLIIVEGINFVGIPTKYTQHYRPELQPVAQLSHSLPVLDKLVYSSHFYAYTGPNATGGPEIGGTDPLYRDLPEEVLDSTLRTLAFYVSNETEKHFSAPVWISEFGSGGRTDYLNKDRVWWKTFTDLLIEYDADFAIWPLVGWMQDGKGDGWAMNMFDTKGQRLSILDPGDWRLKDFTKIVNSTDESVFKGIVTEIPPTFVQLYTAQGSAQQSNRLTTDNPDLSQPGKIKASCPDGLRLHGLSHEHHIAGLCTDVKFGRNLWDAKEDGGDYTVITTETPSARNPDWAIGLTKFQCTKGQHMIGYSYSEEGKMKSIICAENDKDLSSMKGYHPSKRGNRTIYFGKESAIANDRGQWFGLNATAATCADDEILIGTAFKSGIETGKPQAILCQSFN